MKNPKIFTIGEVAKICSVYSRTVQRWFDAGLLKGYRLPGSNDRRIPRENLIKFLQEHNLPLGELDEGGTLLIGTDSLFNDRIQRIYGDNFVVASNGFEAGITLRNSNLKTVVIDFDIGRSEATQIAMYLRKNKMFTTVAIFGLAGEDDSTVRDEFNEVFQKPLNLDLVVSAITRTSVG